jgi:hypothetical protein
MYMGIQVISNFSGWAVARPGHPWLRLCLAYYNASLVFLNYFELLPLKTINGSYTTKLGHDRSMRDYHIGLGVRAQVKLNSHLH